MSKREKMPFYEAVKLNCPNELSCRIEKLLGDCLPENFSPESGKIAEAVSSIVRYASSNTETELKSRVLFTEARNLVSQYVNEYSGLIKSKRLRIVERLAVIQLVQSIWAFPPLAENCDLDAFLSLCEKHRNKIF